MAEGAITSPIAQVATNMVIRCSWDTGIGWGTFFGGALSGGIGSGLRWSASRAIDAVLDANATRELLGLPLDDLNEQFIGYHGTSSTHVVSIRERINPPTGRNFGGDS
jgi:hypothetical protein